MSTRETVKYIPNFTWRADGNGPTGIFDHDHCIARFEERALPGQKHYSDALFQHIYLRPPGLDATPAEPQGYLFPRWRFHVYFIHRVEELTVRATGERFQLYIRTCDEEVRDPDKPLYQETTERHGIRPEQGQHPVFHDEMVLTITYDAERQSYVWDVRSRLTINPGKRLCIPFVLDHLEYQDLFPDGSFWPYLPGYPRRKYQWQVWEASDGQVYKIPLHHFKSPDKEHIHLKPNGIFAYLLEEQGNIAIQLLDDTASRSELAICWWMWDPHIYLLTPDRATCEAGETFDVHYRLFELDYAQGRDLLDQATLRPECRLDGVAAPLFRFGLNTFDEPVSAEVDSEAWFWECNERRWELPEGQRHCRWDHTVSRSGTSSLALRGETASDHWLWQAPFCGTHMRPPAELGPRQRLTAFVKTQDVAGAVRVGYELLTEPDRGIELAQPVLFGTNDWTKVELVTAPSSGGGNARIFLELEGSGSAWLDDVAIENVDE